MKTKKNNFFLDFFRGLPLLPETNIGQNFAQIVVKLGPCFNGLGLILKGVDNGARAIKTLLIHFCSPHMFRALVQYGGQTHEIIRLHIGTQNVIFSPFAYIKYICSFYKVPSL